MSTIPHFLTQLAQAPSSATLHNPYAPNGTPYPAQRRHNLHHYLTEMQRQAPHRLLLAEAPGYRGCRQTGIPFLSPALLQDATTMQQVGAPTAYQAVTEWDDCQREASATIMWQTLRQLPQLPLLWNACPLHPHRPNEPKSNRTPTAAELALGEPFLRLLLHLFPITAVVAVGQKAAQSLTRWGINHTAVRHPAHGGKTAFQTGLKSLT